MDKQDIIFVFGPARGGTTLVGNLLNAWFDVGTGPEGTFIQPAYRKGRRLGDLENLRNRRKFAAFLRDVQMLRIIRERYPEEKRFSVSEEDILRRMPEATIAGGIYAVFRAVADFQGKTRVGNKNPDYWKYLPLLLRLFPSNSKFIFVLRDGRDVAMSLERVAWGGQSTFEAALIWRQMIRAVELFRNDISEDRLFCLRYESLMKDPVKEIQQLAVFLGVKDIDALTADFRANGLKDLKRNNYNKWKAHMTADDVQTFEAIAGPELAECGYERVFPGAALSRRRHLTLDLQRYWRLLKLNLYAFGVSLPQDSPKWQHSKLRRIFRPGTKSK